MRPFCEMLCEGSRPISQSSSALPDFLCKTNKPLAQQKPGTAPSVDPPVHTGRAEASMFRLPDFHARIIAYGVVNASELRKARKDIGWNVVDDTTGKPANCHV